MEGETESVNAVLRYRQNLSTRRDSERLGFTNCPVSTESRLHTTLSRGEEAWGCGAKKDETVCHKNPLRPQLTRHNEHGDMVCFHVVYSSSIKSFQYLGGDGWKKKHIRLYHYLLAEVTLGVCTRPNAYLSPSWAALSHPCDHRHRPFPLSAGGIGPRSVYFVVLVCWSLTYLPREHLSRPYLFVMAHMSSSSHVYVNSSSPIL
jgi:hypothetical protein